MALELITPATNLPLKPEVIRDHLKIEDDVEDTLLNLYQQGVVSYVEQQTRLALGQATYRQTLDHWPCGRGSCPTCSSQYIGYCLPQMYAYPSPSLLVILDKSPLVAGSVSITYTDQNGAVQTLGSSLYSVDEISKPPRIVLSGNLPALKDVPNAVQIEFQAGYSTNTLPAAAKVLILFLVAHWYENRESVAIGSGPQDIQFQTQALLDQLRIPRIY